jgi:type II secretory pathway pseudopilin PulG
MSTSLRKGFTLLEILLFVAIVGIMGGAIVSLFIASSEVRVKGEARADVDQAGGFALDTIAHRVREALSVNATSSTLTLTMSDASIVVIDLHSGRIRETVDGTPSYLTPSIMQVTNLQFVLLAATTQNKRGVTVSFAITNVAQNELASLLEYSQEFRTTISGKEGSNPAFAPPSEVIIDDSVASDGFEARIQKTPIVVFTSDANGYVFYANTDGRCMYKKTANGGTSWGAEREVTAQTDCNGLAIWYDRWTPADTTGNSVHLLFADDSSDDLWYQRLDTTTDTLLAAEVNISGVSQGGSFTKDNGYSITKATGGALYAAIADDDDSFVLWCTSGCDAASGWSEMSVNPLEFEENDIKLVPLAGGSVMLLQWDFSANEIQSKVWNGTAWDGSWTTIGDAHDRFEYRNAWGATVMRTSGYVFLVWDDHVDASSGKFQTAFYNGIWNSRTDVVTSQHGYGVDIAIDENSGRVYVVRLKRDGNNVTKVLAVSSDDTMQTWTSDVQLNTQNLDYEAISLNMMSSYRIYAAAWDEDSEDLYGYTVADP